MKDNFGEFHKTLLNNSSCFSYLSRDGLMVILSLSCRLKKFLI